MVAERQPEVTVTAVTLADLPPGGRGRILELAADGLARRRLLDLGLLPGAAVEVVLTSPLGDPRGYRVRRTTLALRRADAARIAVAPDA